MNRKYADERVRRAREHQEYNAVLRQQGDERRRKGRALLAERFRTACQHEAARRASITLDGIQHELATSVVGLTLKHTHQLAHDAGLLVDWDGVIVRNAAFEDFIR